jgi:pimeloyl-ACP methyl ester carboxylesterase
MPAVNSKDGTSIAYDTIGSGPAVILVDGALGFRSFSASSELANLLAPDFTVYCYDRRGRGQSGDTQPFAVEREIEDIEALLDVAGGKGSVYGISSGGALALEAAIKLQSRVERLAIYEAPYDSSPESASAWREYCTTLSDLIASGRRGDAVALFMKFVGAPDDMVNGMRQTPVWPTFESVAPTLLYDAAELGTDRTAPTERATSVTARTLILDGGASYEVMPFMRATALALAEAIPGAQHRILEGQRHDVDSKVLAPVLVEFFKEA